MISYPLIKLTDAEGGLSQQLPADGRTVTISEVEQERNGRVSSGRLVTDILSSKKKFSIKFSLINAAYVNNLVALRATNNDLSMQFQETYAGEVEVLTVRIISSIPRTRYLATDGGVYSDVPLEIEEV